MAPKGKNRKALAKTHFVNVKDEFENDNDGDEEEEINGDGPQPDEEFNLDEVLRLGGTRVSNVN